MKLLPAAILAMLAATPVAAAIHTEAGDAGSTLATAQSVGAGIDRIEGAIQSSTDFADLYRLALPAGSFAFEVASYTSSDGFDDSVLYLFASDGSGILGDDDGGSDLLSRITTGPLAGGVYYLAFTDLDSRGARDAEGDLWDALFAGNAPPPPEFGTLADFGDDYLTATGSYAITISPTTVAEEMPAVPLPAAMPLLLAGLGGLAMVRRRG